MASEWITLIIAVITIAGNILISALTYDKSQKLTLYRLQQLEDKVNKHNQTIERTYKLEQEVAILKHDVQEIKEKE